VRQDLMNEEWTSKWKQEPLADLMLWCEQSEAHFREAASLVITAKTLKKRQRAKGQEATSLLAYDFVRVLKRKSGTKRPTSLEALPPTPNLTMAVALADSEGVNTNGSISASDHNIPSANEGTRGSASSAETTLALAMHISLTWMATGEPWL
jgi:hypothetical protein